MIEGLLDRRAGPPFAALLFWCALGAAVAVSGMAGGMAPRSAQPIVVGAIGSALMLAASFGAARFTGFTMRQLYLAPDRKSALKVAFGIAAGLVLVALYAFIFALITGANWSRDREVEGLTIVISLAGALSLASFEELAFRGYPLRMLMRAYGLWPAQIAVAAAFAVTHILLGWPLAAALIGTALGSLLFGMAAVATRGLAVPIGLHAAWNFGSWMIGARESPSFWEMSKVDAVRADYGNWIAYVLVAVLGIAFFWGAHRRRCKQGQTN